MRAKTYRILVCVVLVAVLCLQSVYDPENTSGKLFDDTVTLNVWYTDEALTDYLNSAALYFQENTDTAVRVVPKLVSGLEYLEQINDSRLSEDNADVYIVSNDALGKAYLAGLASPIDDKAGFISEENYPKAAIDAVTYQGKIVGCPLYYETSVLLCNETYLAQMAESAIQAEADAAEGEAAMEAVEGATDEELEAMAGAENDTEEVVDAAAVSERKERMIPVNFEEILNFADEYDAPENVESILEWDVTDIFFNYFFVGDSITVGGACGDDKNAVDIHNPQSVEALKVYQSLNQFFSIDADTSSYESVLSDFIEGKTIFTIATTDAISKIEEARAAGKFQYDYTVTTLPDINDSIQTRSMSVTYAAAVNGYSEHKDLANSFVMYLTGQLDESFYYKTGKIPALSGISYSDHNVAETLTEYAESVPVPKLLETSNFWVSLEIAFTDIWNGADVDTVLQELSGQINEQLQAEQ